MFVKITQTCIISGLLILLFVIFCGEANAQSCNFLCNGSFEEPTIPLTSFTDLKMPTMPCWRTTESDSDIEVWSAGFTGVPAYSGNQFVELNANAVGILYQNFTIPPGSNVTISFAHRGRKGVDTMNIAVGPVGGPYVTIGKYGDGNTSWDYRSVNYAIPTNLGNYYSFRFVSIYSTGGDSTIGNFLDDVSIQLRDTITTTSTPINCNGDNTGSISVTADEGAPQTFTYSWSTGVSSSSSLISGLGAGPYTVTVIDTYGCTSTSSVTITQPPVLTASAMAIPTICGDNGGNNGIAYVTPGGGTPIYSYSWAPQGGTAQTAMGLPSGNYTVTVTDSSGCTINSTTSLKLPLTISVTTSSVAAACSLSNGSANASASGGTGTLTYTWSNMVDAAINPNVSPGIYTVTVTDQNGCTFSTSVTVQNNPPPTVNVIDSVNTCQGKTDGAITISTTGDDLSYDWSNASSSQNQTDLAPGSYTVTVSEGVGCTVTASATVLQLPPPVIAATRDTVIKGGENIQLYASGGISYQWTPSGSLNNPNIDNPIATPSQTTIYVVIITGTNNCSGRDTVTVTVDEANCDSSRIFIPHAFSPNGDGQNDILYIRGTQTCISRLVFQIYDRWGEMVFATTNIANGWDGTFRGKMINTGVFAYFFTATLSNGQNIGRSGNITLLR